MLGDPVGGEPGRSGGVGPLPRLALVAGLVVALDQASKVWVRATPGLERRPQALVGDWLLLIHSENAGAAFGMFADSAYRGVLFVFVAILAVVGGAFAVRRLSAELAHMPEFIGLLMGGAIGNSIDRFARGSVTDFVLLRAPAGPLRRWAVDTLGGYTYPAFNVADVAIVAAMLLALPLFLLGQREPDELPPAPPAAPTLD
jgi:signal peptidase II